jgi:antirestriction protein ArdC
MVALLLTLMESPHTEKVRLERPQVFIAYVFNAEQIEGVSPAPSRECSWSPLEKAEQLVQGAARGD